MNDFKELSELRLNDFRAIREAIDPFIHHTPVLTSASLDRMMDCKLYFKCENLQKVGAFKMRGASYAIQQLSEQEKTNGVVTHSSGNHAQALAAAALQKNIPAYIVMPENAPSVKVEAVRSYGGQITFCEANQEARKQTMERIKKQNNATFIPPYEDKNIIKGQATAALELHDEVEDLDMLLAPVGGGGLLSGTALVSRFQNPHCKIYGAEPAGADDALRSLRSGKLISSHLPHTLADGLLTTLGELNYELIKTYVAGIFTCSEASIKQAMRMKIIVEPSAAVPLGCLLEKQDFFKGKRVGIILSGGNISLDKFFDQL